MSIQRYDPINLWSLSPSPIVSHGYRQFQMGETYVSVTDETQNLESDVSILPITKNIETNRIVFGKVSLENNLWFDYTQVMIAQEYPDGFTDFNGFEALDSPIRERILKHLVPNVSRVQKKIGTGDLNCCMVRSGGDITWIKGINADGTLILQDSSKIQWMTFNAYWGRTNAMVPIFHYNCRLGGFEDGGYGFPYLVEDILQAGMESDLFHETLTPIGDGQLFDAVPTDPLMLPALLHSSCTSAGYYCRYGA